MATMKHTMTLLGRARAKTNDSSEEKHITQFFDDLFSELEGKEGMTDAKGLRLFLASARQMKGFAELLEEAIEKDLYGE